MSSRDYDRLNNTKEGTLSVTLERFNLKLQTNTVEWKILG